MVECILKCVNQGLPACSGIVLPPIMCTMHLLDAAFKLG